jgi:alkylation response protein AidB-like acyl-CoA dehydrogenase
MDFTATDEQRQLAESLRRLLTDENSFDMRRGRLRAAPPNRLALWPKLAEIGIIGAAFNEAHNGFAGDARTLAVILSELGVSLSVEPYLGAAVIAGRVLQRCPDPFASGLIDGLIAGSAICVLAHDAGGNPFARPGVLAERCNGGHWQLSGRLSCVRHADVAGSFLVVADAEGDTCIYHVPLNTEGLSVALYRLIDSAGAGDLHLHHCVLPAEARLQFDAADKAVLHDALEWGVLGLAAETAGIVGALNDATFSYLKTRKQFGAPLSSFQALQHRAADMHIAAEEVYAMVDAAIDYLDAPATATRSRVLSATKVVADLAGHLVGHEAVQMHGAMGVSDELNVSHYARRLAAIRAELGSAAIHRERLRNSN